MDESIQDQILQLRAWLWSIGVMLGVVRGDSDQRQQGRDRSANDWFVESSFKPQGNVLVLDGSPSSITNESIGMVQMRPGSIDRGWVFLAVIGFKL